MSLDDCTMSRARRGMLLFGPRPFTLTRFFPGFFSTTSVSPE